MLLKKDLHVDLPSESIENNISRLYKMPLKCHPSIAMHMVFLIGGHKLLEDVSYVSSLQVTFCL